MAAKNLILLKDYEIIKGITKESGSVFNVLEPKASELISSGIAKEVSDADSVKLRRNSKGERVVKS